MIRIGPSRRKYLTLLMREKKKKARESFSDFSLDFTYLTTYTDSQSTSELTQMRKKIGEWIWVWWVPYTSKRIYCRKKLSLLVLPKIPILLKQKAYKPIYEVLLRAVSWVSSRRSHTQRQPKNSVAVCRTSVLKQLTKV